MEPSRPIQTRCHRCQTPHDSRDLLSIATYIAVFPLCRQCLPAFYEFITPRLYADRTTHGENQRNKREAAAVGVFKDFDINLWEVK